MPWEPAWPHDERIVIPGYRTCVSSRVREEAAVKEGLGGRFLTLVHWTNWRVVFPVHGWQQEAVAQQIIDELREGRLVQLLVTNLPKPELNHTLLAYESRAVRQRHRVPRVGPEQPGWARYRDVRSEHPEILGDRCLRHGAGADPGVPDVPFATTYDRKEPRPCALSPSRSWRPGW